MSKAVRVNFMCDERVWEKFKVYCIRHKMSASKALRLFIEQITNKKKS